MMSTGGAVAAPAPVHPRAVGTDAGVQSTNDDAQLCKLSCVNAGYYQDPFIRLFVRRAQRKSPLINRGYWTRYAAMRQVLHHFLLQAHHSSSAASSSVAPGAPGASGGVASGPGGNVQCQVVVLGAGFDTSWFQLTHHAAAVAAPPQGGGAAAAAAGGGGDAPGGASTSSASPSVPGAATAPSAPATAATSAGIPSLFGLPRRAAPAAGGAAASAAPPAPDTAAAAGALGQHTRFIEVDFPEVAARKARSILSHPELWHLLPEGTCAEAAAHEECPQEVPAFADNTHGTDAGAHGGSGSGRTSPTRSKAIWVKGSSSSSSSSGSSSTPGNVAAPAPAAGVDAVATSSSSTVQPGAPPPAVAAHHTQELLGDRYSLVGADLRQLGQLQEALARAGWDPSLPTLWVSECCLIYLDPLEAAALLSWVAAASTGPAAVAIYEQTRPHDAFGRTMLANLVERGCPLRSIDAVPTPGDQVQRLLQSGWTAAAAADMHRLFHGRPPGAAGGGPRLPMPPPGAARMVPGSLPAGTGSSSSGGSSAGPAAASSESGSAQQQQQGLQWWSPGWLAERARVQRLEMLDEIEEWQLLQEHYVLVLGLKQPKHQCAEPASHQTEELQPPASWLHQALQLQTLAALGAG